MGIGSKSHLTKLVAFCNSMTGSMDKETAVNVVYLDLSMVFDTGHGIFIDKLVRHRLNKWMIMIAVVNCIME